MEVIDGTTATVVLTLGGRTVGVVVDGVSDVLELPRAAIKPAPDFSEGVLDARYLVGIATLAGSEAKHDRLLQLVDIDEPVRADLGTL